MTFVHQSLSYFMPFIPRHTKSLHLLFSLMYIRLFTNHANSSQNFTFTEIMRVAYCSQNSSRTYAPVDSTSAISFFRNLFKQGLQKFPSCSETQIQITKHSEHNQHYFHFVKISVSSAKESHFCLFIPYPMKSLNIILI